MTKISQREARELKRRVARLEDQLDRQRNAWALEWPGGTHFATLNHHETALLCHTVRMLKHAVVVTVEGDSLMFRAMPLGSNAK